MKKIFTILSIVILIPVSLQAQIHLFLEEQEIGLKDGNATAWVFPISGEPNEALKDLDEYCKKKSDVKMKKAGEKLLIGEMVAIPSIASKRGDLIAYVYLNQENYNLALLFRLGYDISLNSTEWSTEMENLRKYTKAFMTYHYEQEYARRITAQEKLLNVAEKEKNQNVNKIDNLNKKISSLGKKIGKEKETAKIDAYQVEIRTSEADVQQLMDTLPGLESKITQINSALERIRTESHLFLGTIGSF